MRSAILIGMALAGLSGTGWAQQSSSHPGPQNATPQTQAQPITPNAGDANSGTAITITQLRQDLEKAGFKDINVLKAAYLVEATSKDGNKVVMMINPPNFSALEAAKPSSAAPGNSGGSGTPAKPR